ncbi:MAG: hypothetical protein U0871_25070 [Gemmataceae bacterium]
MFLLGTGSPSFWSVRLGEMRFLLGLSGWTANDWTSGGGALADLAPPAEPSEDLPAHRRRAPRVADPDVRPGSAADWAAPHLVAAGLNRFALLGQLVHDLTGGVYRRARFCPSRRRSSR